MVKRIRKAEKPHLRATPEQVREKWRKGFYTAKGYLHDLLEALRKQGWWYRIGNVQQFCKEWEISTRAFYRAKAELIESQELEESIVGVLELRLTNTLPDLAQPLPDLAQPLPDLAQPLPDLAQPLPDLAQTIAKTIDNTDVQRSPNSFTDLSQLNSFFKEESAQKNKNTPGQDEPKSEPDPQPNSTRNEQSSPVNSTHEEPPTIGQDNFSAAPNRSHFNFEKAPEIHPTEQCDRQFKQEPWGFYSSPDPGFLDFLIKTHLKHVDPYKNYSVITKHHARKWLRKARASEDRYDDAMDQWEAYQEFQVSAASKESLRKSAEVIPLSAVTPSPPIASTRESLIARLRVKARIPQERGKAIAEARAAGIPLSEIGVEEVSAS